MALTFEFVVAFAIAFEFTLACAFASAFASLVPDGMILPKQGCELTFAFGEAHGRISPRMSFASSSFPQPHITFQLAFIVSSSSRQ